MKNEEFLKSMNIANSGVISEKDMSNVVKFQDELFAEKQKSNERGR